MKLLICGGRTFNDYHRLDHMINTLNRWPTLIIEGGAPHADTLARKWARTNGVHFATVPALWEHFKNNAGPRRNEIMLSLKPDMCLAMPGGNGTADMISRCKIAGIEVVTGWK